MEIPSQGFADLEWTHATAHMPNLRSLSISGSCHIHLKALTSILDQCKMMEALDVGTVLEASREGGDLLEHCMHKQYDMNLRLLRMSDSSFGKKNGHLIDFSAADWNNSSPRRSSECSGLLHRKKKTKLTPRLLKVEIFESGFA